MPFDQGEPSALNRKDLKMKTPQVAALPGMTPLGINPNPVRKFVVGKTYTTRSICDYDTIYRFEIVARTAKQMTIREHGEIKKRGIFVRDGVEYCKPHGTYSMCAIISADREVE
jgi:hypothetical protein